MTGKTCTQRREHERERGLSNSVQWAVLFPAILLCTIGIIQAGVWVHGRNVAIEAANAAVDASRGRSATAGDGQRVAQRVAAAGGLTDVTVDVDRGADRVRVTFTARVPMFFDLGLAGLQESAAAPVEQVTTP